MGETDMKVLHISLRLFVALIGLTIVAAPVLAQSNDYFGRFYK
jgi:hypothetical protein